MSDKRNTALWPDMSAYGLYLRAIKTPLQQLVYTPMIKKDGKMIPYRGSKFLEQLTKLGFRKGGNMYWHPAGSFSLADYKREFPHVNRDMVSLNEVLIEKPDWIRSFWRIGHNDMGEEVFLDFNSRRVTLDKNGTYHQEPIAKVGMPSSRFLRAWDRSGKLNEDILNQASDGFVQSIMAHSMTRDDIIMFASSVCGEPVDGTHKAYRKINDTVEAAIHRRIHRAQKDGVPPSELYDLSRHIYDNQPKLTAMTNKTIELQQYSTPAPMAAITGIIAGKLSEKKENRTVLEPCIGTGSLIGPIPNVIRAYGIEKDADRIGYIRGLSDAVQVLHADATIPASFDGVPDVDIVVANPPFGGFGENGRESRIVNGLKIQRIDYLIAVQSLDKLKDDGTAVLILGGDSVREPGKVRGGTDHFMNWLYDHYKVKDFIEVDGRLYGKQGANFPVRMVVIEGRGPTPGGRPDDGTLRIVKSYDELWSWQNEVTTKVGVESEDVNTFQTKYVPASDLESDRQILIPKNMFGPVSDALQVLANDHDDIDAYVGEKLGMTHNELCKSFSAAQVDALALAIGRFDSNRGFILGDQTGFGKGRVMAGMIRYSLLQGKVPVFLTEKDNLFSDMMRDLKDIGSESMVNPLIMNADTRIFDDEKNIILRATSQNAERKRLLTHGDLGDFNMIMATYSQFNRLDSVKSKALMHIATNMDAAMLLDEAHNAAGDGSNVNRNITQAISSGNTPVMFASATAIKTVNNLDVYMQTMGNIPYSAEEIVETAKFGGEELLQVLNSMLASDGAIIRREFSLDDVTFSKHEPDLDTQAFNNKSCEYVADFFYQLSLLSGECKSIVGDRAAQIKEELKELPDALRKSNKMGVEYMTFASSLHNLNRQLMLALRVDELCKSVTGDLHKGLKPVLAMDHTMDALVGHVLESHDADEDGVYHLNRPITFKDALLKVLDRLTTYKESNAYGVKEVMKVEDANVLKFAGRLRSSIENNEILDKIELNVFDKIIDRVKQAGVERNGTPYNVSEFSGRKWSFFKDPDGKWCVKGRKAPNRNEGIYNFNNGESDVMILSGAGSTGLSLHSSSQFNDQRKRILHIAQPSLDSVKFMQMMGRVNRNGQVVNPEIRFHTAGLIGERRELGGLVCKISSLMASSTANRESKINDLIDDNLDVFNHIGDRASIEFLESNPEIASRLDIDIEETSTRITDGSLDPGTLARRVLGRITLIPPGPLDPSAIDMGNPDPKHVMTQQYLFSSIMDNFVRIVDELESQGENPFKVNEYDWHSKTRRSELYSGIEAEKYNSPFDEPVFLEEIEFTETFDPISSDALQKLVDNGISRTSDKIDSDYPERSPLDELKIRRDTILQHAYSPTGKNIATPADINKILKHGKSTDHVLLRRTNNNLDLIKKTLAVAKPGQVLIMNGDGVGSDPVNGVLTRLDLPKPGHMHRPSAYIMHIAIPGEKKLRTMSLSSFFDSVNGGDILHFNIRSGGRSTEPVRALLEVFDDEPRGERMSTRVVMSGNLFNAAMNGHGKLSVVVDGHGVRRTVFLLPKTVTFDAVMNAGVKEYDHKTVVRMLEDKVAYRMANVVSDAYKPNLHMNIMRCGGNPDPGEEYQITVPGTKVNGAKYFGTSPEAEALKKALGGGDTVFVGEKGMPMIAKFAASRLSDVVQAAMPISKGMYIEKSMVEKARDIKKEIHEVEGFDSTHVLEN